MNQHKIDITKAAIRPFTDIKLFVLSAILFSLPVVNLFAPAYFFRCIRRTYNGHYDLPGWGNLGGLIKDWAVLITINAFYFTIPILLMLFLTFSDKNQGILESIVINIEIITIQRLPETIIHIYNIILSNTLMTVITILAILSLYFSTLTILIINDKENKNTITNQLTHKSVDIKYLLGFITIYPISGILYLFVSKIPLIGEGISNYILGTITYTIFAQIYLTIK